MDAYARHNKIWPILQLVFRPWMSRKFGYTFDTLSPAIEGPVLLVPNHVTAWDPLLVSLSLPHKQIYFVASEHIFRLGVVTKLLNWTVGPIPRPKAGSGVETVKQCLRHLRAGHSICLFAEGEQSWDGLTAPIFPATGKLARSSGATLVTYRLEGGYLSLPRWGRKVRKGNVHGGPVGVYTPERLRAMTPQEINAAIQRDIFEDAAARERETKVPYRSRTAAESMERAVYLCPDCRKISTLRTKGDRVFCACGFSRRYTEFGCFDPPEPFETVAGWDRWQKERLAAGDFAHDANDALFSDGGVTLTRLWSDHRTEALGKGRLEQVPDRLRCAGRDFPLDAIDSMALVRNHILLLHDREGYYELRGPDDVCMKKYLDYRNARKER